MSGSVYSLVNNQGEGMALSFGKREPDPVHKPASPVLGAQRYGSAGNVGAATPAASSPTTPAAPLSASQPPADSGGSKLTVGPNIKLKGVEITDCDTLVVEGLVEATMDSRVIQIAETGAFKGSAEIDIAEIRGVFEGSLTVRQKLVIHATGRVTGKIRYGKVVIEEGGQLSGDIECTATPHNSPASTASGAAGNAPSSNVAPIEAPVTATS
jgi:cytoskeletal protein CcmA (bactofilin family)